MHGSLQNVCSGEVHDGHQCENACSNVHDDNRLLGVQTEGGGGHNIDVPLGYKCGAGGASLKTVSRTTGRSPPH